ncbi:MAG: Zn-dependent hydrolase [Bacteroidota bacterium]|nr:Zn-dependent hydrolase [Bacteroidota bacterium]
MNKSILFFSIFFVSFIMNAQKPNDDIQKKINQYKVVKLEVALPEISNIEREGIRCLVRAAKEVNEIFKLQSIVNYQSFFDSIKEPNIAKFFEINYGPWDRLDNNKPFLKGVGEKPKGAGFYPQDMTLKEFNELKDSTKNSPYTVLKRENGQLVVVPYNIEYISQIQEAFQYLNMASEMINDPYLAPYLKARALALITNEYDESDRIWMDMMGNKYEIIIGPIENYEDQLLGIKTSFEAYVLIKDLEWSKRLEKYVAYLPELQKNLPVDAAYKKEKAGTNSQIGAYDAIYYAGDCNAGSKTMAVNLPNDETLQLEKGTKRLQIKNVMNAKFEHILMPISNVLIDSSQRKYITFNAFFTNTMFHEVAHGLGIKNTINNKGTVRQALGPDYSALEEGKADILGLFMVTQLFDKKILTEGELMDYYVTFMASIFRSVRFGASSAHGKANMIRFNYFKETGAFVRNDKTGTYKIDFEKMKQSMNSLSALILKLQGDGDIEGVKNLINEKGKIAKELQKDLDRLSQLNIPVDLIFEQDEMSFDINFKR